MLTITQQQSLERWDVITPDLREALFSDINADFVSKTCNNEHLPEEKSNQVAGVAGYVLLGFMHPDDLAEELKKEIGIDPKTAASIAAAINQRIFSPLRQQIDQVYSPISKLQPAPKLVPDTANAIAPFPEPTATPSAPAPKIISETFVATPKFASTPLASNRDIAAPAPRPPQPPQAPKPSDAGWSKSTPQQPVVKLGAIPPGVSTSGIPTSPAWTPASVAPKTIAMPSAPTSPTPSPAATPTPAAAKTPVRSMSEFERLDLFKKGQPVSSSMQVPPSPLVATPTASTSTPQPAPVMLHQVSSFAPIQNSSAGFNTKKPAQDQLRGTTAQGSMPTRPAVVEFGGNASAPSQVNYQPPVQTPPPMANSGPRQMTEIQAPRPVPPAPSVPPVPMPAPAPIPMAAAPSDAPDASQPLTPSTTPASGPASTIFSRAQKSNVIVKDFLGPAQ
jgi:hypothetical protein